MMVESNRRGGVHVFRILALSLIFMLVGLCALGQEQKFRFGVHVDPQLVFLTSDIERFENKGAHMGVNTGLDVEWMFAERYSIATGASFDLRRANVHYSQPDYKLRTAYEGEIAVPAGALLETKAYQLQLPICIKMRSIEIGYTTIYAMAGLTSNFTFNQNASSAQMDLSETRTKGMYYVANLGFLFQAGVEYSLGGASSVQVGVGYNGGITPAYDCGKGNIRVHAVQLRLGFVF